MQQVIGLLAPREKKKIDESFCSDKSSSKEDGDQQKEQMLKNGSILDSTSGRGMQKTSSEIKNRFADIDHE